MALSVPPLAAGSLLAGFAAVFFLRYLWPYRDELSGRLFIATICCEALWSFAYGAALFVHDPALRALFEIPIWLAINFIGVFFLGFALAYTGRGRLLRSPLMAGVVGLQTVHTLLVATNPLHHIAYSDYQVEAVAGAATVTYSHQPWLFVNAAGFVLMIAGASFLLVDTVLSYGPLYRTQAAAIALSPIFPGLPFLLWLFEVGASPPVNLTPLLFPVHLAFDMYAFFSRELFETAPAARRIADREAIDTLGSAVLIVDENGLVIEANEAAARVLDRDRQATVGDPIENCVPELDLSDSDGTIERVVDGRRRVYAVTISALEDATGTPVGRTIVFQDVTAERRREQRLTVLNRVLRHNLRNDLNVVDGQLRAAAAAIDDDGAGERLETAAAKTAELMALGETARTIERAIEPDARSLTTVSLATTVEELRAELRAEYPDAVIAVDVPGAVTLRTDAYLLEAVLRALMENACVHATDGGVALSVSAAAGEDLIVLEVADDGPGIPAHELSVLESGTETALEHGSGLGLWLVRWGVDALGGSVAFETDATGTTATLELPA